MKPLDICCALLVACLLFASCGKHSGAPYIGPVDDLYSKWTAGSIETQSYFYPSTGVSDTTYKAQPGDFIDFSQKGVIVVKVQGNVHTDLYDTMQYDLLKDTLVELYDGSALPGRVSVKATGKNTISFAESRYGIDFENKFIYSLHK